jgi:uncharacterized protein (DUF885 family)
MLRKRFVLAVVCFALGSVVTAQRGGSSLDGFFENFTSEWIRGNPNLAASTRYFTGDEQDRFERQITPETLEYREARIALARKGLASLAKFNRAAMTPSQRVSADVMQWQLDMVVRQEPFLDFQFPLEQFGGANVNLPALLTVSHPLNNEKDAVNYVARLGQVAPRMTETIAEAKRLIAKQMIPPKFIVTATIAQMQNFIASPPAQNPFVTAFSERIAGKIPDGRREELRAEAEQVVARDIYPTWQHAIATLQPLVAGASDAAGLSRFKNGTSAYALALERFTTTKRSADEIHNIGLMQVQKLESQMDTILKRLGRTEGSVKDRIAQLKKDQAYPLTEDGRTTIMADVNAMLADSLRRSADLFDHRPKAPVVAQPFPRFREANAAASYTAPSPDGARPGTFQIPLRSERMTKFGLRTLVNHETVPGHHFQIALEMEDASLPRFRRLRALGGVSALSEGWGLYAERLANEEGWYADDPEGLLGQLDAELFRARRLVVDTGLHTKNWTRQQAIDYGIEASEIDRYVVYPGQACSYMMGELKLIELRDRARTTLGPKFSFKDYHNAVLAIGSVPLSILEQQVDAYIAAKK